jgi:hypothetical protein
MNPHPPYNLPGDPDDEFQGDVHAADIVSPTGEEMPIATHAEVHRSPDERVLGAPPDRDDRRG